MVGNETHAFKGLEALIITDWPRFYEHQFDLEHAVLSYVKTLPEEQENRHGLWIPGRIPMSPAIMELFGWMRAELAKSFYTIEVERWRGWANYFHKPGSQWHAHPFAAATAVLHVSDGGGALRFRKDGAETEITPRAGQIVMFEGGLDHQIAPSSTPRVSYALDLL